MTTTVFIAVIAAALLHAVWNALIKGSADKHLNMTALVLGSIPISVIILFIFPLPATESWGYIIASFLVQLIYHYSLLQAYEKGDLSQVYPIARGSAPLIVAIVAILFLSEKIDFSALLGIVLIVIGVLVTAFIKHSNGTRNAGATIYALITGCCIAAYSIIDGLGARLSGNAFSYFACIAIAYGIAFPALMEWHKSGIIKRIPKEAKKAFWIGGNATFIAYAIVVWAFTQAPITLVTALRETSISFALLIGILFLNEKFNWAKALAIVMTLIGVILLKLYS